MCLSRIDLKTLIWSINRGENQILLKCKTKEKFSVKALRWLKKIYNWTSSRIAIPIHLFTFIFDCYHYLKRKTKVSDDYCEREQLKTNLICDMHEEESADEDSFCLSLLEILLQRRAELFRIFYKFLLPLLYSLLAGCSGNETDNLIYSIQQLFNGTCDLSDEKKHGFWFWFRKSFNQLTLSFQGKSCDRWSRQGSD